MTDVPVKADNLEVNEVPDGYVVYEGARDKVHYLNKTAAVVFELCDGEHEIEEIVLRVAELFNLEATACNSEVRNCVESLSKEGLVLFRSK
jgi:Coenzyme PQQ synthesis protein D (PqqD)